jgi:Ca2+-binding RTX toxin-like protein
MAGSLTTATIQSGIEEVVFNDAIATAQTLTLDAGTRKVEFESAVGADGQTFTIADTGSATNDSLTIENGGAATDVFSDVDYTINGFESVTIDTSGTGAATTQNIDGFTINADTGGTTSLTVTGSNAVTTEAITAATIDFSGLTPASTGSTVVMGAAAVSVTTITGSEGNDTLLGDATSTIKGMGGIDQITGGTGNDVIEGGAGNDILNSSTGTDSVKGEAGNDVFAFSTDAVSAGDVYDGGDGTDVIAFNANMTDSAGTLQSFSNFEVLRLNAGGADTITMSNLLNTQANITSIQYGDGGGAALTVNNVGDTVTSIQLGINAASINGDTAVMDRLVDGSANSLTVTHDSGGAAATVAVLTIDDEETVTLTTDTSDDDLTITSMNSADMTTLNVTGSGDVIISGFAAVTDMPTTVDASGASGAVTVPLTSSVAAATMEGGSGIDTFTGGLLADTINGNAGNDILSGGNGADTINGGLGSDNITDGAGGDAITTGANQDTVNAGTDSVAATSTNFAGATVAVGDTMTFGNGVDVVTDFTAGSGGDILNVTNATEVTLVGETVADLTNTTTFFASGTWDAASKTFLILADGSGADTMVIENPAAVAAQDALTTNPTAVILVGVDSDDLVAANIV